MLSNPWSMRLVLGVAGAAALSCLPVAANAARLSPATPAALQGECSDLMTRLNGLANTRITASSLVAEGGLTIGGKPVPAHCRVTGVMHERVSSVDGNSYGIGFELRLPLAWNGRFFHQGNGGLDGSVVTAVGGFGGGPLTHALLQGFAVLSSDAGHAGSLGPTFGIDPQARLDYGYQAVAKLTPMAKSTLELAYGKQPDRSYFGGCSNGGRHTLVAAARYGDQYDGFLAGAPGYNLPKAAIANIFGAQQYAKVATSTADLSTAFTTAERSMVSAAVLAKCDALDGATDGLIQDVKACQTAFNFKRDVPNCKAGVRDGACLTRAQKAAIAPIFSGAVTSTGAAVYSSFPFDAGHGTAGVASWEFSAPLTRDSGAVGLIFKVPPESPSFNGPAFALSADIGTLLAQVNATNETYTESGMSFMAPPNPTHLDTVKNRGGKVMVYHGVSDPIFSYDDSVAWLKGLRQTYGAAATAKFAQLYAVPGMGHCSGGPATDQFDMLSALVNWVEQGQVPTQVLAQARGAGNAGGANTDVPASWAADRSRPLCPFPKVARYKGSGSVELASSFSCQP